MIHWLQIGGMRSSLDNEQKQWNNLKQYLNDYPNSKVEIYYKTTGDMFARFIRLECEQNYDNLDLDCNSLFHGSLRRLNSKPSNIELSPRHINEYFDKINKQECV